MIQECAATPTESIWTCGLAQKHIIMAQEFCEYAHWRGLCTIFRTHGISTYQAMFTRLQSTHSSESELEKE
jgi:hypothetical protein